MANSSPVFRCDHDVSTAATAAAEWTAAGSSGSVVVTNPNFSPATNTFPARVVAARLLGGSGNTTTGLSLMASTSHPRGSANGGAEHRRQYRGHSSKCDTLKLSATRKSFPATRTPTAGRLKTAYDELCQPVHDKLFPQPIRNGTLAGGVGRMSQLPVNGV